MGFNRLQTRLTMSFLIVAMLPLLLVGIVISQRSYTSLQDNAYTYLQNRSDQITAEVDAFVSARVNILQYIARIDTLFTDQQTALLNSLTAFDTTFQELTLLDINGMEINAVSRTELLLPPMLISQADSPAYEAIAVDEQEIYFSEVRFDEALREPLMTIAVPINDQRTGDLLYVLVADFRLQAIWQLLGGEDYAAGETIYITDASGTVLAHRNPSVVLRNTQTTLPDERIGIGQGLDDAEVLYATENLNVGNQNFIIVAEQTTNEALSLAYEIRAISLGVLALSLLVVIGLTSVIVRSIVSPIEELVDTAQRITRGDLSKRTKANGTNEFSQLASAFNKMADQLSRLIADLEARMVELKASEEQYRLLAENAQDIIYRLGLHPEPHFEYVSPSAEAITGYTPEDYYNNPDLPAQIVYEDDRAKLEKSLNPSTNELYILRWYHKNGSVVWTEHRNTPSYDEAGNLVAIDGISRDITARKRAEQALSDTQTRYKMLSDLTFEGIVLHDSGVLLDANAAFLEMFGYAQEELIGHEVISLLFPEAAQRTVWRRVQRKDTRPYEVEGLRKDGSRFPIEIEARQLNDKLRVASLRDISKRKQQHKMTLEIERLKARFQKEQEQNILVQRIISALSHDLRTPLTVIASSKDILSRYHDRLSDEKRQEKLQSIGRQIQFALDLLDDTVQLVRGNLKERRFEPVSVNLAALCRVSVEELSSTDEHQHKMTFINQADVHMATVDEIAVSRILLNLLSNAIKYSPAGSEIRLELDTEPEWFILRVSDEGMGIAKNELPHIFDPFYRTNDVQDKNIMGTGLGLSIVADGVQQHKGQIDVESTVGEGTTFIVKLPRRD